MTWKRQADDYRRQVLVATIIYVILLMVPDLVFDVPNLEDTEFTGRYRYF